MSDQSNDRPYPSSQPGGPEAGYPSPHPGGPEAGYPSPYPGGPAGWGLYPEGSQAVLAFVLGIIGLFVFQPLAPFAWVIANREIRGVDAGRRNPGNRGLAVAGKVMAIIGTIFLILGVIIFMVAIIFLVGAPTDSSTTSY